MDAPHKSESPLAGGQIAEQTTKTDSAVIVLPEANPSALIGLAEKINEALDAVDACLKSSMVHALTAGRLLVEAKKYVPHGDWETWLRENCSLAPRTTQAYMQLTKKIKELPPLEAQRIADLPVREALKAIAIHRKSLPLRRWNSVKRDDVMHAVDTFRMGGMALRDAAAHVDFFRKMEDKQVQSLRRTLNAVFEVLDQLGEKSE
jgi:hypothetical protein